MNITKDKFDLQTLNTHPDGISSLIPLKTPQYLCPRQTQNFETEAGSQGKRQRSVRPKCQDEM